MREPGQGPSSWADLAASLSDAAETAPAGAAINASGQGRLVEKIGTALGRLGYEPLGLPLTAHPSVEGVLDLLEGAWLVGRYRDLQIGLLAAKPGVDSRSLMEEVLQRNGMSVWILEQPGLPELLMGARMGAARAATRIGSLDMLEDGVGVLESLRIVRAAQARRPTRILTSLIGDLSAISSGGGLNASISGEGVLDDERFFESRVLASTPPKFAAADPELARVASYPVAKEEGSRRSHRVVPGDEQEAYLQDRNRIAVAYLRLVLWKAQRLAKSLRSLELRDLFQEGVIGLCRSLERFDPRRGARLSTYATHWISQAVRSAIRSQDHMIRKPSHIWDQKELTDPVWKPIRSLDQLAEERLEQRSWPLPTAVDPHMDAELVELRSRVLRALRDLPGREREVLTYRFGLRGRPELTLEQLGERLGVTRERVRQMEAKAMTKLRTSLASTTGSNSILDYLDADHA